MSSNITSDFSTLVGSRICHDLISPVGAINNGLELLGMSNTLEGPELELISDSVNNANARIRFFRIAFGAAGDQDLGRAEIMSVLADLNKGGRVKYTWSVTDASRRSSVRLAFLAGLSLETALPYGGTVEISNSDGTWTVRGEGRKIAVDPATWTGLLAVPPQEDLTPALVQFPLLSHGAQSEGKEATFGHDETSVWISF